MSTFTFRDLKLYYVTFFIKQNIKLSHLWNHKSFRRSAPWISACKAFSICVNWERFWERFSRKNCVITLPAITARVIQLPGNHSASWSGVGGYGNHISFRPSSLYKSRLESPARSAGRVKWSVSPERLNAQEQGTPLKIDLGEVETDVGVVRPRAWPKTAERRGHDRGATEKLSQYSFKYILIPILLHFWVELVELFLSVKGCVVFLLDAVCYCPFKKRL